MVTAAVVVVVVFLSMVVMSVEVMSVVVMLVCWFFADRIARNALAFCRTSTAVFVLQQSLSLPGFHTLVYEV